MRQCGSAASVESICMRQCKNTLKPAAIRGMDELFAKKLKTGFPDGLIGSSHGSHFDLVA
jgi:hypothetical protein